MSFPRYPKYKESGVEWLGQVPEHWSLIRYKNVFTEKESVVGSTYPAGSISYGRVVFKDDEFLHEPTKATYQEVRAGEFLINPINLNYDLKSLRTALSDINTRVSPAYIVLKAKGAPDLNYLKHQLHVFDLYHMKTLGAGVRQTITFGDIGGCFTALPPLPEQTAIADFLDRETAKIDGLIAEQERLIELLKEKRQAVISHAVTKGLNPDAPMKDSGIEWIGQVPEHWEVKRLKHVITKINQGSSPQCDSEPALPGEWGVLKVGCVRDGQFYPMEQKALPQELEAESDNQIAQGDIIMSRGNSPELVGSVGFINQEYPGLLLSDLLYRFQPTSEADGKFLTFFLSSSCGRFQIERDATGTSASMKKVSQETVRHLNVCIPFFDEQSAITAFLDRESAKMDILTSEAQKAITLLQERRSALISAAVTGQIDVRGIQHQEAA